MKNPILIASMVSLLVLAASCQKDELQQLGVDQVQVESSEKIDAKDPVPGLINDNGATINRLDREKKIGITVKEVSDGDEESDDDENQNKD